MPGRRLDPFDPRPPEWSRVRADEVVRQIFAFEPGPGGWGPAGGWGRRRATTPPVLRFSDRHIVGTLDLRAVELPHLLEFVRCRFEEPPDLRQTKLAGCEFAACRLPGLEGRNLYSDNDLRLVNGTLVEGRVDLTDAEISGSLELTGSQLVNVGGYALHADRLQLAGALLAANLEVHGQMRVPGLRTGGNINLAGAVLNSPEGYALDGNGLHVGGNLQCIPSSRRRFQSTGRLYLPSARIDSDFSLRGALLTPADEDYSDSGNQRFFDPRTTLIADRMQVSGNVVLDKDLSSTGTLRIVNARIGGSLQLSGATIDLSDGQEPFEEQTGKNLPGPYRYRALHLDGTEIGGGIDARHTRIAGQVRLVDVNARGSVVLDGSVLSNRNGDVVEGRRFTTGGNLDARSVVVFGSILLPEANIGANLDLRFSRLVNPGRYRRDQSQKPSLDLRVARIGRDLVCAGDTQQFSAYGEVRIRRAEIGRQTNFQGAELGSRLTMTAIDAYGLITQDLRVDVAAAPRGLVNLRHARCATLKDNDKFWDATGNIALDDFRYDTLAEPIELDDDAQVKRRLKLLRHAMGDVYRPGPYDHFSAMLRAGGNEEHATTVMIEKQRWRYATRADGYRFLGPPMLLWSWLQRWMVGYGYHPMRAVATLIVLVAATIATFATFNREESELGVSGSILVAIVAIGCILLATVAAGISHRLSDFATSTTQRSVADALAPAVFSPGIRTAEIPQELDRQSQKTRALTATTLDPDTEEHREHPGNGDTGNLDEASEQTIAVEAYLDTDNPFAARAVFSALDDLVEILGYERPERETIQRGSWWRRTSARGKKRITPDEIKTRLIKVERALELAQIELRQAEVDVRAAEAVNRLLASLQDIPQACVRAGSVLVIKYEGDNGPVVFSRPLSQLEIRALERFPEIQSKPRHVLDSLATAITTLDGDVNDDTSG